ncbi:MAG TPA: UDP-N-acetylglucosamine 2-epimerase (non-hydrolyzing) [Burkholderiales bacterium]|jgi:UDP-N-acetylglucosamine 2-epimerase (non-hydrolysing)|nr:UDP-N-acetylglucosamine 2-epimerase (non-hydrolyzing) [Burkholderiales bacterium]
MRRARPASGKNAAHLPQKVMTIVGTRPEIIKLSCVIPALDAAFRHVLVHTGQNYDYELNEIFFKGLGIRRPDHFLQAAGASAAETIARVIAAVDPVLAREKPDAVLILGDTNSCLAAIAAKRRRIPVFHMEAGNRCFDERVPEEINRRMVDHISDINLPYTEHARRYLLAEGIRPETVLKTGSPMKQVLAAQRGAIRASRILDELKLRAGRYFVASAHREENVDDPARLRKLIASLEAVSARHGHPVVFSTHPRTRKRLDALRAGRGRRLRFLKPLGFADYIRLQTSAACVLSDSGTITEESSLLGFPAVMLREAHERPEGMDEGTLIMCGIETREVLEAVGITLERASRGARPARLVPDYDADDVARKVVNAISSYRSYVDRVVWRKG